MIINIKINYESKRCDEIKSRAYVTDTFENVIYTLNNTNNYKDAVLKSVNR